MSLERSIASLIERLDQAGFDLQASEIADILWLYKAISAESNSPRSEQKTQFGDKYTNPKESIGNEKVQNDLLDDALSSPAIPPQTIATPKTTQGVSPVISSGNSKAAITIQEDQTSKSTLPYRAPVTDALPEKLAYSRALRPLTRRISSLYDFVLDVDATVQRIADDGIWVPVLRPALTRWLELDVVVDEAPSMEISYTVVDELIKVLETLGAFTSIQVWGMTTKSDDSRQLRLHPGFGADSDSLEQDRHPKELISNPGQGLVLVISDCVSESWYDGKVGRLLETWGEQNSVLLLQTLPRELWDRTGLVNAIPLQLSFPRPGSNNQVLNAHFAKKYQKWSKEIQEKTSQTSDIPSFMYLPVATLTPTSLGQWAKALAGNTMLRTQGYWLPTNDGMEQRRQSINRDLGRKSLGEMDERERLQRFLTISSPLAQRLAGLMAAIPLSLPVMRLVQRAVLPESGPEHMAEFFLGGLIVRRSDAELPVKRSLARIQYQFLSEISNSDFDIRKELLRRLRLDEIEQIWLPVAGYMEQHADNTEAFEALVSDPAFVRPFALVGSDVLRRRGGRYAEFAEKMQGQNKSLVAQSVPSQTADAAGGNMQGRKYIGKTCHVIMPFGKKVVDGREIDFDFVYHEFIKKAVEETGIECTRADEIIATGSIIKKMMRSIFDADVAIVDITSLNPNIFYELGIRHALRKHVTLVIGEKSNLQRIPFDISGMSILGYGLDSEAGLETSRRKIGEYIQTGLDNQATDSIVHDALEDLRVVKKSKIIEKKQFIVYQIAGVPSREIGIITGTLMNIKEVDVWVIPQNTNMQLPPYFERSLSAMVRYQAAKKDRAGRIAEDIIEKELENTVGTRDVFPGAVLATGAGELRKSHNVKRIFHAATYVGQPGVGYSPINDFNRCVRNALELIDSGEIANEEVRSIIFPLFATGSDRMNAAYITEQIIDAAIGYMEENPSSKVTKIYFLAYTEQDLEYCRHTFINDPRIAAPSDL